MSDFDPRPTYAQLRLPLAGRVRLDRASFIAGPGNREALRALEGWRAWPGGCAVLVGPEASGKSHLGAIWAAETHAETVDSELAIPDPAMGPLLLEDADQRPADESLFHLFNAAQTGGGVLMTARGAPRDWATRLPDLRSRLNALHVIALGPPDDDVLLGVLNKFFLDRGLRPESGVTAYLARRIERSTLAARQVVALIDEAAQAERRDVTRAFARDVLDLAQTPADLFEQGCGGQAGAPKGRG